MRTTITSSPWGFRELTPKDYCRAARGLGLESICMMVGDPAAWPLAIASSPRAAKEAKDIAEGHGLRILEAAIRLDCPGDIDTALAMGAAFIRVCEVWEPGDVPLPAVGAKLAAARAALPAGTTLIVENHGGLMADAAGCARLLDAAGPDVKLNFDAANFVHFGGQEPLAALQALRGKVGFMHVKNVTSTRKGEGGFCGIAEGRIDYRPLLALVAGLDVPLAVEHEDPADPERGTAADLAALRRLLGR